MDYYGICYDKCDIIDGDVVRQALTEENAELRRKIDVLTEADESIQSV